MTFRSQVNRLRLIIYPKFQLSLLLGNVLVTSGIFFFVYMSVKEAFTSLHDDGVRIGLEAGHPYFKFVEYQSETILKGIFFYFIIGVLISTLWMLLLSNKLSGPILRLRGYFAQIAEGKKDYSPISFRKGDFFIDLPPVINKALERISER